jgi:hypothetical protein
VSYFVGNPRPAQSPQRREASLKVDTRDERMRGELPAGWDADIPLFPADPKGMKTRVASGKVMNAIAPKLPTALDWRRRDHPPAGRTTRQSARQSAHGRDPALRCERNRIRLARRD